MKQIRVKVKAKSRKISIEEKEGILVVSLTAPAVKNKANRQLIKVLAKYYQLNPSQIIIESGFNNKLKIVKLFK